MDTENRGPPGQRGQKPGLVDPGTTPAAVPYVWVVSYFSVFTLFFTPAWTYFLFTCVGFVAAAVSMSTGGCRARRLGGGRSVTVVAVDIPIAAELAVL